MLPDTYIHLKNHLLNDIKNKYPFNLSNKSIDCSLCLEYIQHEQNIIILDICNHSFCKKCIYIYMNNNKHKKHISCPLCRVKNENLYFDSNQFPSNYEYSTSYYYNVIRSERNTEHIQHVAHSLYSLYTNNISRQPSNTIQNNLSVDDIEERDIVLIIGQINCSRQQAIDALLANGGDIANAMIELELGH